MKAADQLQNRGEQTRPDEQDLECDAGEMTTLLSHGHNALLQHLLAGKLPRSLKWSEVVDLMKHMGEVVPHGESEDTFVIQGQQATFKRPHHNELEMDETSRLRKFLREATQNDLSLVKPPLDRMIVVIDHHAAHVFKNRGDGVSALETSLQPYDPFGFHHHLIYRKEAHYRGDRIPEETSFYEGIAGNLASADEIILIGHAIGTSGNV